MMKYRKKPIEIEAIQHDDKKPFPFYDAPDWIHKAYKDRVFNFSDKGELLVITMEGNMKVSNKDYIIRGVQGEIYPCKPDIFEQTYEKM